ncbi:MAG: FAD-dependent oxidoreductase [Oscillospiraceae bacterium]|nr:FAD-dependent oxidoreductase [Oscillospiraceae bacterium]
MASIILFTSSTLLSPLIPSLSAYRALIAPAYPNLLVAGRPISADRKAFASMRVQASCMGTGQAAGVAAAMATKGGCSVHEVDIELLVDKLKSLGAAL